MINIRLWKQVVSKQYKKKNMEIIELRERRITILAEGTVHLPSRIVPIKEDLGQKVPWLWRIVIQVL